MTPTPRGLSKRRHFQGLSPSRIQPSGTRALSKGRYQELGLSSGSTSDMLSIKNRTISPEDEKPPEPKQLHPFERAQTMPHVSFQPGAVKAGRTVSSTLRPRSVDNYSNSPAPAAPFQQQRLTFEVCLQLSRELGVPFDLVRTYHEEFTSLAQDGNLSPAGLEKVIRIRQDIPDDEPFPPRMLEKLFEEADADGSGEISFQEYVNWCNRYAFVEQLTVASRKDRQMRQISRKCNLPLEEVERVSVLFEKLKRPGTNGLNEEDFRQVVSKLLESSGASATRLRSMWAEVDTDNSGLVDFEEFVVWYLRIGQS